MRLWKFQHFDSALEQEYSHFIYRHEVYALRRVFVTGMVLNFGFLVVDYLRDTDFFWAAFFRGLMIAVILATIGWTYLRAMTPRGFQRFTLVITTLYLALGFMMDRPSQMPEFFLPNFVLLMVYILNAGLGHSFLMKVWQNATLFAGYTLYALSPLGQAYHRSQIVNVTLNIIIAGFIGYLIEHYKRRSFIQQKNLAEAKQELEALGDFKNKIISILSHDLNSPLNSLSGLLHLRKHNHISQDEFNDLLPSVQRSLDSATYMLDTLLRWSKTQLEGFRPSFEEVDLKGLCEHVVRGMGSIPDDKRIQIQLEIPDGFMIITDRQLVSLAVRNLLVNSIKFSNPDSVVTVTARSQSSEVLLSIRDEGVGMSQEEITKLFTVKKRSETGTLNESGTGMGLILVREFLQKIRASISVTSAKGRGTAFTIHLPTG
jgi:signal transduction histidine kinase